MPQNNQNSEKGWRNNGIFATVILLLLLAAMALVAWFVPPGKNFLVLLVLLALFFLALGTFIAGRPLGVLVNERHLMSLSRFQMVFWTIIVLAGYISIVAHRMQGHLENALAVEIAPQLWMLMGISVTSLVGSGLVLNTKRDKVPEPAVVTRAVKTAQEPELEKIRQGTLYANEKPQDANFKDLFQGDEVGNTTQVDLAKAQMFFFTMVIGVSYAADLFYKLGGEIITDQFPPLSDGVVTLMGISHAGYLASKGVDHSQTKTP